MNRVCRTSPMGRETVLVPVIWGEGEFIYATCGMVVHVC